MKLVYCPSFLPQVAALLEEMGEKMPMGGERDEGLGGAEVGELEPETTGISAHETAEVIWNASRGVTDPFDNKPKSDYLLETGRICRS